MEGIQKICHHDISALSAQSEIRLRTRGIFDSGRGHPSFPCSCPVFQRSWGSKGRWVRMTGPLEAESAVPFFGAAAPPPPSGLGTAVEKLRN